MCDIQLIEGRIFPTRFLGLDKVRSNDERAKKMGH
jgi:hypothetical protein